VSFVDIAGIRPIQSVDEKQLPDLLKLEHLPSGRLMHVMLGSWIHTLAIRLTSLPRTAADELFDCDLLFVHNVILAGRLAHLNPDMARRKLVLVPHSPKYLSHEVSAELIDGEEQDIYLDPVVRQFTSYEISVMNSVRAVLWPSIGSQDGYENWAHDEGANRSIIVPTCTPSLTRETYCHELRAKWGVTNDQKMALFMGRPHPHKGFAFFVELARYAKSHVKNEWVFIHAGSAPRKYSDLMSVDHVGYVFQRAAAYAEADLVLICNQHTFMDLGLLEAMSLGASIAVSPTGGHREILEHCPALTPIPLKSSFETTWDVLRASGSANRDRAVIESQIRCWEGSYSLRHFIPYYESAANDLLDGKFAC